MSEVDDGKLCAILAYIFPIGLIWYFADKKMNKNKFASFHVKQGLVLFILVLIINVVSSMMYFIGGHLFTKVAHILVIILFIIGLVNAGTGKKNELPVIGQFAKSFKF